jgi:hypothetical protein
MVLTSSATYFRSESFVANASRKETAQKIAKSLKK